MKEPLLVSACLLGINCKYNGGNNSLPAQTLAALGERYRLAPVCPERDGGLPTPRVPSERRGCGVFTREGEDVTAPFRRGAQIALETAKARGCRMALLKERSPSCGAGAIYDGSFTGKVFPGDGITAELLRKNGLTLLGETEVEKLLD